MEIEQQETNNTEQEIIEANNHSENSQELTETHEIEQEIEQQELIYPEDYSELEGDDGSENSQEILGPQQDDEDDTPDQRGSYLESLLEDQQSFINSLESAENQLMLDENFILLISNISNKNTEEMFDYDYRDQKIEGSMQKWLDKTLETIKTTLENALSFYNDGLFKGQFKKLQKMMKIFHCKSKEIYVVKEDSEKNKAIMKGFGKTFRSNVDQLIESMVIEENDDMVLSIDDDYNNHLHKIKSQKSMMKMSIGKGEGKLNIYIRGIFDHNGDKTTLKKSRGVIPSKMLKHHFFEFFTSVELFKMRLVCREWKDTITDMWHGIFKREMHNHLLMTECTKEVEKHFKLMAIRQPVSQKFCIYATALSELIEWSSIMEMAEAESNFRRIIRLFLTAVVKFIKWDQLEIEDLSHYTDVYFNERVKPLIDVENINEEIQDMVKNQENYPTLEQINVFCEKFLDYSEIWMSVIRGYSKREIILLRLLCRHMAQFGKIRNSTMVSKKFLGFIKTFINQKKYTLTEKKSFLEGAYKIMVFSNSTIINGKVVTLDSSKFEQSILEGMRESIQVTNLLQDLFTNEDVLTTFLSENRTLIKEYFQTMELYRKRTEQDEILEKIEKEAKDVQGALQEINSIALESIGKKGNNKEMKEEKEEEIQENQKVEEEKTENNTRENLEEKFKKSYVEELIEKVNTEAESETNSEPLKISLKNEGYVTILKKGHNSPPGKIHPSFLFSKKNTNIKIFMDSGATNKFLSDALRYLECIMQVKRLNMCLRMQFESVQSKLMDVEKLCQKQIEKREELEEIEVDGGNQKKVDAQIETVDLEELEEFDEEIN